MIMGRNNFERSDPFAEMIAYFKKHMLSNKKVTLIHGKERCGKSTIVTQMMHDEHKNS